MLVVCCVIIVCFLITLQIYNDVLYLANFSVIIFQKNAIFIYFVLFFYYFYL